MKNILLPVDHVALASSVAWHARPLMRCSGSETLVLRVVPPDHPLAPDDDGLGALANELRADGIEVAADWIDGADVAGAIIDHARANGSDLIVMATQGRAGDEWAGASVTARVLRDATTPLLLFNPWSLVSRFRRALVPLDGSETSTRILSLIEHVATVFGSEVILLRVVEDGVDPKAIAAQLEPHRAALQEAGLSVRIKTTPGPDVADAILRTVQKEEADLVAMTTHGKGHHRAWAFGSVAEKVFRHCTVPLLIKRTVTLEAPLELLESADALPDGAAFPKKVLVPVDGSQLSRNAAAELPTLLQDQRVDVVLLRVASEGDTQAEAELAADAAAMADRGYVTTTRLETGDPAAKILEAAASAELVVMPTRGRSGVDRWVRGSVAARVLRHCPRPLLLLTPASLADMAGLEGAPMRRILVPLDGSARSAEILPAAAAMARVHDAKLVLFSAHQVDPDERTATQEAQRDRLDSLLEPFRVELERADVDAEVLTSLDEPVSAILREASVSDLVAMATHGRTGVSRWWFGSVAERVLRHCTRPLLIVRAG